ncbi:MAG: NAD(+)/NADH kinase [bacterium]|jgi:NAD+ kinase|nr:NAD(+)/NADH kinase [bacterium]
MSNGFPKAIGVISHPQSEKIIDKVKHFVERLEERCVVIKMRPAFATALGRPEYGCADNELVRDIDLLLVLGGDGSFLGAARLAAPVGVPILGVDLGTLGFLTEVRLDKVEEALSAISQRRYTIDERMMLQARVLTDEKERLSYRAMNDVVVAKGSFSRMIRFKTYVDNRYLATYAADGIILATPTGSTAYSLSAGGPVVNSNLSVIIVTPICAHSLHARSLVVSGDEEVRVKVECEDREAMITVDGQEGEKLIEGDVIVIKSAPYKARVVKLHERNFYTILRTKLKWGGDYEARICDRD